MAYKRVEEGSYRQVYGALPNGAVAELDEHADLRGLSRSQMISTALLDWLQANDGKRAELKALRERWAG